MIDAVHINMAHVIVFGGKHLVHGVVIDGRVIVGSVGCLVDLEVDVGGIVNLDDGMKNRKVRSWGVWCIFLCQRIRR